MRRLGGWHRLWIALSAAWLPLIVAVVAPDWPSEADAWRAFAETYLNAAVDTDDLLKGRSASEVRALYPGLSDREFILTFEEKYHGQAPLDRIALNNLRSLDAISQEQTKTLRFAVMAWVVPVMLIYILGWAVAWVRKGFKRNDAIDT